jgi:hypothetical protein
MAKDELTGNMPTEQIIQYLQTLNLHLGLDLGALSVALQSAQKIFGAYA